ncbi:hypothetical protein TPAR_00016 [Tolypocladium paradoxum]|uniref:Uncharacterized protein n=1 Tax=Tolypocladium paradoxum TaxID=94208 RepID=A0A2S4LBH7_9HYPO|nr:hypothetical protein TPAR_00016 [Tolypocladium paradoxum]
MVVLAVGPSEAILAGALGGLGVVSSLRRAMLPSLALSQPAPQSQWMAGLGPAALRARDVGPAAPPRLVGLGRLLLSLDSSPRLPPPLPLPPPPHRLPRLSSPACEAHLQAGSVDGDITPRRCMHAPAAQRRAQGRTVAQTAWLDADHPPCPDRSVSATSSIWWRLFELYAGGVGIWLSF